MSERRAEYPLDRKLRLELLYARERVYRFGEATPLDEMQIPIASDGDSIPVWVKREDLSDVKSYKWRGAANRMACLTEEERARGVVTASAGNHAQGVASAARRLGVSARIYMPRSTPEVKIAAVKKHGGDFVEIQLVGDSYDEAVEAAKEDQKRTGSVYAHAYDDLQVMAGQGTLADEVVLSGKGPFDIAYLQIGGGGMASAAALWLKTYWPDIEIVGVEGEGQACLKAALEAGEPVTLPQVDIYCDGTAVRRAGDLPFAVCREVIDRMVTVSNTEVNQAIRVLWDALRCVSEPSGAMGLAALLQEKASLRGKKALIVISGANIDFLKLGLIAQNTAVAAAEARTLRIRIPERPGATLELLDRCFAGLNVTDFQYGKTHPTQAWPIVTVAGKGVEEVESRLSTAGFAWENVTGADDVIFRAIPLREDLLSHPVFLRLDFYERKGALHDFLDRAVRGRASLIYFNYRQTGEQIGRALLGLEFDSPASRELFLEGLAKKGEGYRSCTVVEEEVLSRITGGVHGVPAA